jgi:DNA polymerase elongation subunit (family B)
VEESLPGWDYVDIVYDIYTEVPVAGRKTTQKQVTGHNICRFAQPPDSGKGIIPRILMDLLGSRKTAKNRRDDFPKGSFRYNIYEGLQLAYKVTANSLYGIIGASTSKIRLKEIAACTTAVGRKLIMFTSAYITKNYPGSSVVYGDTDSVFIKFDPKDRFGNKLTGLDAVYKTMEYCMESAMCVSRLLKRPHNLEFEKVIFPFVLVSKKRYHGHYYTEWGNPKYSVKSMGIVLKRRDNADIVKHIFGGMMDIIMKDHSTDKAIRFVQEECKKVLAGQFPIDQFIITKTLRGYYASPDSIAHNVLAQRIGRRDPGNKPRGNDRIPFAYIQAPATVKLQGDRIETPSFIQKNGLKLDYVHYITNQIAKPVSQIFELAGKGADVFDRLLMEYEHEKQGIRKITDFFKVHDRKLPIKFNDISDQEEEEEDEEEE